MFLKLFKYDFRASARFGVPLLIAIAVCTVLGCINTTVTVGGAEAESTFGALTDAPFGEMLIFFSMGGLMLIGLLLSAASAVMTVLLLVQFYRSTVSDEAYLTYTLPVTPAQILWSKLLNTLVWSLFTGILLTAAGASILGCAVNAAGIGEDFVQTFGEVFGFLNGVFGRPALTVLLTCMLGAASSVSSYLMLFMAITAGGVLAIRHKAAASLLMVIVTGFVTGTVSSVLNTVLLGGLTFRALMTEGLASVNVCLTASVILHTALAVLYFLVTVYMMEKKLNLE